MKYSSDQHIDRRRRFQTKPLSSSSPPLLPSSYFLSKPRATISTHSLVLVLICAACLSPSPVSSQLLGSLMSMTGLGSLNPFSGLSGGGGGLLSGLRGGGSSSLFGSLTGSSSSLPGAGSMMSSFTPDLGEEIMICTYFAYILNVFATLQDIQTCLSPCPTAFPSPVLIHTWRLQKYIYLYTYILLNSTAAT